YIKKQSPEICIEAVKENGYALKYVEKQTSKICLEAVRKNGLALKYVEDQLDKICVEALKKNKLAIRYVKDKEKYLKEFGIKYLEAQGEAREVIAIRENNKWLFTLGCQYKITKEEFIYRIYNTGEGFNL
ncbi:DUF4116 domain-containing protein, partial [Clostridioides difficile]